MHKFRDMNPAFKTWTLPAAAQIVSACLGGAVGKDDVGRAHRLIREVFTRAIIFKDPLCVFCKASLVCLLFILIRKSFCYKSELLKAFFHASQVAVKNFNPGKDTDHKDSQSA